MNLAASCPYHQVLGDNFPLEISHHWRCYRQRRHTPAPLPPPPPLPPTLPSPLPPSSPLHITCLRWSPSCWLQNSVSTWTIHETTSYYILPTCYYGNKGERLREHVYPKWLCTSQPHSQAFPLSSHDHSQAFPLSSLIPRPSHCPASFPGLPIVQFVNAYNPDFERL